MNVAFLGLGRMGQGMAARLAQSGVRLTVYNRTRAKCDPLAKLGATVAATPAEAVSDADIVCTMLADDATLAAVMSAETLLAMPEGSVHVSMSTISVALADKLAASHAAHNRGYVACPVFGRPDAAAAGQLQLCFAGETRYKEKVVPVLQPLGTAWDLGDRPSGANAVKLAGNFLLAATIQLAGEAFSLVENNGVAPGAFFDLMTNTLFNCTAMKNYGGLVLNEQFDNAGFTATLAVKDMGLVREAALQSRTPMPVAALVQDRMLRLLANGMGDKDWSVLGEMQRHDAGKKA